MAPFNKDLLRLARQFYGFTQRELGERIALSHSQIAYFESGKREPTRDVVEALAAVLEVTPDFFYGADSARFTDSQFNFRDQITATERLRRRVTSFANLFAIAVERINEEVETPPLDLPRVSPAAFEDMELAASEARDFWGIGRNAPIGRMMTVLENSGVIVTPIRFSPEEVAQVDALSGYGDGGIVLLNVTKESTTRARFNMAHEIGHGIVHRDGKPRSLEEKERDANHFAGAFLLPKEAFSRDFRISGRAVDGLIEMKLRWGVSLQAILMRARELDLLDAAEIRVWFRRLSKHGWRQVEPAEPEAETEQPRMFEAAAREWHPTPADQLAVELKWSTKLVTQITGLQSVAALRADRGGADVISLDSWRERAAG